MQNTKQATIDIEEFSDVEKPWVCSRCGEVCGRSKRPRHIRECGEYGGGVE